MAEFLIAYEATGNFEQGDIIAVCPDGHPWGRRESIDEWVASGEDASTFEPTPFSILYIRREPPDLNLTEPHTMVDANDPDVRVRVSERAWHVDMTRLSRRQRDRLSSPGARIGIGSRRRNAIRRKHDDRALPDAINNNGSLPVRAPDTTIEPIEIDDIVIVTPDTPGSRERQIVLPPG